MADSAGRLAPVVRLAPAKLNLTLAVVGRRPDGFHELHSVMVPLALSDRLSLARAVSPRDTLRVEGRDAGPAADNLVLRAIGLARAAVGRSVDAFPLAARLEKRIPVAAGLAGGSSDAAAAIDAALEAWGRLDPAAPPDPELDDLRRAVAARAGSDVPFFLAGGPALVEGRGERVTRLGPIRGAPPGVLLVTPAVPSATPDVFAAFDAGGAALPTDPRSTRLTSDHLAAELRSGLTAAALVARAGVLATANDLGPAAGAVVAGLGALRRALARRLGRPVGVSGSGPTLWVLYPSASEAEMAAAEVRVGLDDGSLAAPGEAPPAIIATSIAAPAPARPATTMTGDGTEERT
ncbi:MAG: 4-(cytidine 5'-diphospho)-2-C-methyl-D-erythritol kinase [Chloroflexota bacterium]